VPVVAVPPEYTTQDCSGILSDGSVCAHRIRKSLSMRTHICPRCGLILDRNHNAAAVILQHGLALARAEGRWRLRQVRGVRGVRQGVPWGTRERTAWGQPGSCVSLRDGALPRLADPGISRIHPGRVSTYWKLIWSLSRDHVCSLVYTAVSGRPAMCFGGGE
jgi:hypothetical protein